MTRLLVDQFSDVTVVDAAGTALAQAQATLPEGAGEKHMLASLGFARTLSSGLVPLPCTPRLRRNRALLPFWSTEDLLRACHLLRC